MNWTLTFNNDNGKECRLDILGMQTSRTLHPATHPFVTRGDTDNDPFKAIRSDNAVLTVICKHGELDELFEGDILSHPVRFYVDGILMWIGYVKQEAYTQPYLVGWQEQQINLGGILEVAQGVFPSMEHSTPVRLGNIIYNFLVDMHLEDTLTRFAFTTRTPADTTIDHYINFSNIWPHEDGECTATWSEVLEEICKCFGWQLCNDKDTLYFMSIDCDDANMNHVDIQSLLTPRSQHVFLPAVPFVLDNVERDHSYTYLQGKNKVRVSGDVGAGEGADSYDFSLDELGVVKEGYRDNANHILYAYLFNNTTQDGSFRCIRNIPETNYQYGPLAERIYERFEIGWMDKSTWQTDSYYGASFEAIGMRSVAVLADDYHHDVWTWIHGLCIVPHNYGRSKQVVFSSKPVNVIDNRTFFNITGTINSFEKISRDVLQKALPTRQITLNCWVRFSDRYLTYNSTTGEIGWTTQAADQTPFPLTCDASGNIVGPGIRWFEAANPWFDVPNGAFIPLPNGVGGQVEISIQGDAKYYIVMQNLTLKEWQPERKYIDNEKNEEKSTIDNGTRDSYEVESNLTCARGHQTGYGCILDKAADGTYTLAQTLDNTNTPPEKSYIDRLVHYFSTPYRTFELGLKQRLAPNSILTLASHQFAPVAQNTDWRTMSNKVNFIEIK